MEIKKAEFHVIKIYIPLAQSWNLFSMFLSLCVGLNFKKIVEYGLLKGIGYWVAQNAKNHIFLPSVGGNLLKGHFILICINF